jgi:hypothetical protein
VIRGLEELAQKERASRVGFKGVGLLSRAVYEKTR